MSIFAEKRGGKPTGRLRVEVQRNGRAVVRFATSQKEARKLEAEIRAGLHDGLSVAATHSSTGLKLLRDEIARLWENTRDAKQSTQRAHVFVDTLEKVLRDMGAPNDLKAVKTAHITETIKRLGTGRKAGTVNRYVSAGSKLFAWALEQEHIEAMPKFAFKTEAEKPVFFLSEDDEARLYAVLQERGHEDAITIMRVQLASGCRISEILGLKSKDVVDDGDGFYSLNLGITKNGKERLAVIPEALGRDLAALVARGLPSYRSVWRRLKSARVACGLPTTQPTHAQRHTIATRLAGKVNALLLQDFMGHSSLNTTRRYVHNDTSTKKDVLRNMMRRPEGWNSGQL